MRIFTWIALMVFLAISCQKVRHVEPVVPGGNRIVLLEEFTGKGCTNCPKGSREIDNLLSIYDTNLVVVSIHAGFFANPTFFPIGQHDLRTDKGEKIFSMLSPNSGYPSGVVDRVKVNGVYQINSNQWAAVISSELEQEPGVEFTLARTFNDQARSVQLDIEGLAKRDIGGQLRVSVMVTETGIIDAQDDQEAGGIVDDYTHKHVLRAMPTAFDGDVIKSGIVTAEPFEASYTFEIPDDWDADNCEIIVFLSEVQGGDIHVIQAGSVGITH